MNTDGLLDLARLAFRATGDELLRWWESSRVAAATIDGLLKAEADVMAHRRLCGMLQRSGHPVLSEESAEPLTADPQSDYWLIDPLDGTASFVNGFRGFVTQGAFMSKGRPAVAVVYAPALNLFYEAVAGRGALLNGQALVALSDGPIRLIDNYPEPRGIAREVYRGLKCGQYIESGSLGLKICRVADGTASLFVKNVRVRDWDLAAPDLVLREAGGTLSTLDGRAVAYTGNGELTGFVAAASRSLQSEFLHWYRNEH